MKTIQDRQVELATKNAIPSLDKRSQEQEAARLGSELKAQLEMAGLRPLVEVTDNEIKIINVDDYVSITVYGENRYSVAGSKGGAFWPPSERDADGMLDAVISIILQA